MKGKDKNILINEQYYTRLLRSIANTLTRRTIQNAIKGVADDLAKNVGDITLSAIKKNTNYQKAMIEAIDVLSRSKYGKGFSELAKAEQDVVAKEVGVALSNGVENELKSLGRAIKKDITQTQAAQNAVSPNSTTFARLAGDVTQLQKQLDDVTNTAITNFRSLGNLTTDEVSSLLKNKVETLTNQTISPSNGFKFYFDKIKKKFVPTPKTGKKVALKIIKTSFFKGLITLGVGGGALYYIFSDSNDDQDFIIVDENGKPYDTNFPESEYKNCLVNLLKSGAIMGTTSGGRIYLSLKNTGEQEYDNKGGLIFYTDGKVSIADGSKTGNWYCQNDSFKSSLNEQIEEDAEFYADVDKAIDLLDFPVSEDDVEQAYAIVYKYYQNGRGKKFLDAYENAGDFKASLRRDVKNIYFRSSRGVDLKQNLINLYDKIISGQSLTQTNDNGQTSGGQTPTNWRTGITIEFPEDSEDVTPVKEPEEQNIIECESWDISQQPYKLGCKATKIAYIQKCLGDDPIDGIFDSRLQKILANYNVDTINGINKAIFDELMSRCNNESSKSEKPSEAPKNEPNDTSNNSNLKLSNLVPKDDITTDQLEFDQQNFSPDTETGGEFYLRLLNNGYLKTGRRKIGYKDSPLSKSDYTKLSDFLSQYGYIPKITKDIGNGKFKYIWISQ